MTKISMVIVFRTDASTYIGTGHVMRCLTLADELTRKGHKCRFICREHEGHLGALIVSKGYELTLLPSSGGDDLKSVNSTDNAHADWLGVPWQQDATQTLEVLYQLNADWLVGDHYALDARWERQVSTVVGRMMVIDDLSDRPHQADLLLDQNVLGIEIEQRYKTQVNSDCKLLFGPRYALLGQEYHLLANALPERDGQVSRILVFVGGSDPHHLTERYLKALDASDFQHLLVDVVVGKNHPAPVAVSDMVSSRKGTRLYFGLPSLSALMIRADLMLGAGGATNWERMCLGLNSIVVSAARNQDEINRELAEQGFIHFLGKAENITVDDIQTTIRFVLDGSTYNRTQSLALRKVVDGRGTERIAKNMMEAKANATT